MHIYKECNTTHIWQYKQLWTTVDTVVLIELPCSKQCLYKGRYTGYKEYGTDEFTQTYFVIIHTQLFI